MIELLACDESALCERRDDQVGHPEAEQPKKWIIHIDSFGYSRVTRRGRNRRDRRKDMFEEAAPLVIIHDEDSGGPVRARGDGVVNLVDEILAGTDDRPVKCRLIHPEIADR